jgi:hypothetical protein
LVAFSNLKIVKKKIFFLERPRSASPVALKGRTVNLVVKEDEPIPTLVSSPPSVVPSSTFTERPKTASGPAGGDVNEFYERANLRGYHAIGANEPPVYEVGGKKVCVLA